MAANGTKFCNKCKTEKSVDQFNKRSKVKDGLQSECNECRHAAYKRRYAEKRDHIQAVNTEYRKNNEVKVFHRMRKNYLKTKELVRERARLKQPVRNALKRSRKQMDPDYRKMVYIKNHVRRILKNNSESERAYEWFGVSVQEARNYIASKFKPGMSWENHGEWHIDHIVPFATARNLTEFLKLLHYTNMQPLWASENYSKGAKNQSKWRSMLEATIA